MSEALVQFHFSKVQENQPAVGFGGGKKVFQAILFQPTETLDLRKYFIDLYHYGLLTQTAKPKKCDYICLPNKERPS